MAAEKGFLQLLEIAAAAGQLKPYLLICPIQEHDGTRLRLTDKVVIDHDQKGFFMLDDDRIFFSTATSWG